MRRLLSPFAALGLAAALGGLAGCFSERSQVAGPSGAQCGGVPLDSIAGATIVVINNFAFQPGQVTITTGTKVTWVNCEPAGTEAHTSTSDAGLWSSALLDPGEIFSFTFHSAGSFAYHCETHPSMQASIIVQ